MKKRFALIAPLLLVPLLNACKERIYTVTFDTVGGNAITANESKKGQSVEKPANPIKLGYDFVNWTYEDEEWNFDTNKVNKDITLKANYVLHDYTVTFKNSDGTVLEKQEKLHFGDVVTYKGETPVAPNQEMKYTYTFKGWDKELKVTDDMVFTALYNVVDKKFHVKYQDTYANKVLYELYTDNEEDIKGYPYALPEDEVRADGMHYHFLDWDVVDDEKGEKIYTAKYERYSTELTYERNVVTGYTGTNPEVIIPAEHNGRKVEIIGAEAFKEKAFITSVEFPNTIDDVYHSAFEGCTGLKSVEFKDGLHYLESKCFKGCTSLETVSIPNTMILMSENSFENCPLLKYNVYKGGLYLGNSDNPYLVLLTTQTKTMNEFEVHEQCKIIGGYAFYECDSLASISIPSGITDIGSDAFGKCTSLTGTEYDNCIYLGNENNPYVVCYKAKDTNITATNIHEGCTHIYDGAFNYCNKLIGVSFPNSIVSLGMFAFANCAALKSVVIPEGTTVLSAMSFDNCSALESVTLPNTLLYIEPESFLGCKKLTSINIPSSVIYIGFNTFALCQALESFVIPEGITDIYSREFEACTSLQSITIPESVEKIESNAFLRCTALTSIIFQGSQEQWDAIEKENDWNKGAAEFTVTCQK